MSTDSDYVNIDDVRASLGDFLDAVGHEPLTAQFSHATWEITRRGQQYHVNCFGRGGGWYNERDMSRRALMSYLQAQEDLRLKRPESQRPD